MTLARDHQLTLASVDDAMSVIASGISRPVFTLDDLPADFLDLKNRLAGEVFQKLINYRYQIAIVVPKDHQLGTRITELAREHAKHPVVRFFTTEAEALAWSAEAATP